MSKNFHAGTLLHGPAHRDVSGIEPGSAFTETSEQNLWLRTENCGGYRSRTDDP
jgi:hypothetical protein